jgi:hypothetical protein
MKEITSAEAEWWWERAWQISCITRDRGKKAHNEGGMSYESG